MGRKEPDRLTVALRQLNIKPQEFAVHRLGISYQMWRYRIRQGRLTLEDYHKILLYTGQTFEELFPNPLKPGRHPITLNLNHSPGSRLTPPPAKELQPQPLVTEPVVAPSEPEEFKPIDIYGGGLPPDDPNAV